MRNQQSTRPQNLDLFQQTRVVYPHSRTKSLTTTPISQNQISRNAHSVASRAQQRMNSSYVTQAPTYHDFNGYLRTNLGHMNTQQINNGHLFTHLVEDEGDEYRIYGRHIATKSEEIDPHFNQYSIQDDLNRNYDDLKRKVECLSMQNEENRRYIDELTQDDLKRKVECLSMQNEANRRYIEELAHEKNRLETQNSTVHVVNEGNAEIIEEIVEEEQFVRRKPRAQVDQMVQETVASKTAGVGDIDYNRYHLVDMFSPNIDPNSFPPEYWYRLKSLVLEDHIQSLPSKQDFSLQLQVATQNAATSCNPSSNAQKNFGMVVRPATSDAFSEITETPKDSREVGCMVEETDERLRAWIQQRIGHHTSMNQEIIQELVFLFRNDREAFLEMLSKILSPSMRSQEVDSTVKMTSKECATSNKEFSTSVGVGDESVSVEYSKRPSHSQAVSARPELASKSSLTEKVKVTDHGSITDAPMVRSLGTNLKPVVPPCSERGTATDNQEFLAHAQTNTSRELFEDMIRNAALQQAQEISSKSHKDYQIGLVSRPQQTELTRRDVGTSPQLVSQTVKSCETDLKLLESLINETIKKREASLITVDAQTVRQETVDAAFSPPSASPRQVRVQSPGIEYDGSVERKPSQKFARTLSGDPTISDLNPNNRTEAHIFKTSGIPSSTRERIRDSVVSLTKSPTEHIESSPSEAVLYSSVMQKGGRYIVPERNHTYRMSEQMRRNCEILASYYNSESEMKMSEFSRQALVQVTSTWFDLTRCSPIEVNVLADFMAILHQYSPKLLESVVRSADNKGSTALHYAVGHGSWSVVTILLDTGFADVDQLNSMGYSSLMVAAISQASTDEQLKIVDRLFSAGDVNQRSQSDQCTPLILASREGLVSIVTLLLSHRASVNAQDQYGNTALMCAVERRHSDVVKRLLMRPEIDLTLRDNEGKDALQIATESQDSAIINLIERQKRDKTTVVVSNRNSSNNELSMAGRTALISPSTMGINTSEQEVIYSDQSDTRSGGPVRVLRPTNRADYLSSVLTPISEDQDIVRSLSPSQDLQRHVITRKGRSILRN